MFGKYQYQNKVALDMLIFHMITNFFIIATFYLFTDLSNRRNLHIISLMIIGYIGLSIALGLFTVGLDTTLMYTDNNLSPKEYNELMDKYSNTFQMSIALPALIFTIIGAMTLLGGYGFFIWTKFRN